MSVVKRFVKNNPFLFATMKKGLLYVRYAQSLFETSPYKGLQKKKSIIITGKINSTLIFLNRFVPREVIVNVARKLQELKK